MRATKSIQPIAPLSLFFPRLKLIFCRPEGRQVAKQIQQAFAVLPEALAKTLSPGGIGIKAFDVYVVEVIELFF